MGLRGSLDAQSLAPTKPVFFSHTGEEAQGFERQDAAQDRRDLLRFSGLTSFAGRARASLHYLVFSFKTVMEYGGNSRVNLAFKLPAFSVRGTIFRG